MSDRASRRIRKTVANIEHIGNRLVGKEILGALKGRAVGFIKGGMPSYAKGGKVRRTGVAKVHKGELVIPAKQAKALKKLLMH